MNKKILQDYLERLRVSSQLEQDRTTFLMINAQIDLLEVILEACSQ